MYNQRSHRPSDFYIIESCVTVVCSDPLEMSNCCHAISVMSHRKHAAFQWPDLDLQPLCFIDSQFSYSRRHATASILDQSAFSTAQRWRQLCCYLSILDQSAFSTAQRWRQLCCHLSILDQSAFSTAQRWRQLCCHLSSLGQSAFSTAKRWRQLCRVSTNQHSAQPRDDDSCVVTCLQWALASLCKLHWFCCFGGLILLPFLSAVLWFPSVVWRCWLGGRKSIRPVKTEWWGTGMVICLERGADDLHMVQLMPLSPQMMPHVTVACIRHKRVSADVN